MQTTTKKNGGAYETKEMVRIALRIRTGIAVPVRPVHRELRCFRPFRSGSECLLSLLAKVGLLW